MFGQTRPKADTTLNGKRASQGAETFVPLSFTPPDALCGVGAIIKSTKTVLRKKDSESTEMEIDQLASTSL